MADNGKAMIMAAFAADAFALGAHWIYDVQRISEIFGRVETLQKPAPGSFHASKEKGDFTHYGDQMLVLLESLAESGGFDPADFSSRWRALFEQGYQGWVDEATRVTLSNLKGGAPVETAGSPSNDLAGGIRIAPLVQAFRSDPSALPGAVETQTRMTHNNQLVVASARFFANVTLRVLDGESPVSALEAEVARPESDPVLADLVARGIESRSRETGAVIVGFGQTCHAPEALPGVVHLIARYEDNLKEALIENVMAGGDSAARGTAAAMVLGAYSGLAAVPKEWITGMRARDRIVEYVDRISRPSG